jgi:hypothetical protein
MERVMNAAVEPQPMCVSYGPVPTCNLVCCFIHCGEVITQLCLAIFVYNSCTMRKTTIIIASTFSLISILPFDLFSLSIICPDFLILFCCSLVWLVLQCRTSTRISVRQSECLSASAASQLCVPSMQSEGASHQLVPQRGQCGCQWATRVCAAPSVGTLADVCAQAD